MLSCVREEFQGRGEEKRKQLSTLIAKIFIIVEKSPCHSQSNDEIVKQRKSHPYLQQTVSVNEKQDIFKSMRAVRHDNTAHSSIHTKANNASSSPTVKVSRISLHRQIHARRVPRESAIVHRAPFIHRTQSPGQTRQTKSPSPPHYNAVVTGNKCRHSLAIQPDACVNSTNRP